MASKSAFCLSRLEGRVGVCLIDSSWQPTTLLLLWCVPFVLRTQIFQVPSLKFQLECRLKSDF